MAEQVPQVPDIQSSEEGDEDYNMEQFQTLQQAEMDKLGMIAGPLKEEDSKSGATTPLNSDIFSPSSSSNKKCPFNSADWDMAGLMTGASARAKRDIASLYSQPLPGIFFVPKESDFTCVNSMIIGNFDTPYEGGFFFFYVRFGPQYPFEPPRVCAMSCYRFGNKVRFNPNMYEDGTVCLSILGTWRGPAWTAANNLAGVLLSIQSLFCDQALCNEPGFSKRRDTGDKSVQMYDVYVRHETLRVAVIHTIEFAEEYKVPPELITVMRGSFMEYYDSYIASCDALSKYDGQKFSVTLRLFHIFSPNFAKLKEKLIQLHAKLLEEVETKKSTASGENKFFKDNTPAAASSESSLSELSDDSSPNSCSSPSKDATTSISASASSAVPPAQDETQDESVETVAASTSSSASKNETGPKRLFTLKKMNSLTTAVQSLLNVFPHPGGSSVPSKKHRVVNTKVANIVKIDSARCEKIVRDLASQDEAVPTTSSSVDMEECLDFMSFMADSDVDDEYEEQSDSDAPLEDEDCGNVSGSSSSRISEVSSKGQQKVSDVSTSDKQPPTAEGSNPAECGLLCDPLLHRKSSPSPGPNLESDDAITNSTHHDHSEPTKDKDISNQDGAQVEMNVDLASDKESDQAALIRDLECAQAVLNVDLAWNKEFVQAVLNVDSAGDKECAQAALNVGSAGDKECAQAVLNVDSTDDKGCAQAGLNVDSADDKGCAQAALTVESAIDEGCAQAGLNVDSAGDKGCAQDALNVDSAGRGLKRESSGVIKVGLDGEEKETLTKSPV